MGTMLFSSLEACCETNGYPCTAEPSAAPITQKPTKRAKATKRPTPVQRVSPAYSPTPSPSTKRPTPEPTVSPTYSPTPSPTYQPSPEPTKTPRREPTKTPTREPTPTPTKRPTAFPTPKPTKRPTPKPTPKPTKRPTPEPTRKPTKLPTRQPNFKAQFWYPDIHALDNRCVFGSNYEEWMDTVDHRDAYLFTTEHICCIEHNCADGPPPPADAPPRVLRLSSSPRRSHIYRRGFRSFGGHGRNVDPRRHDDTHCRLAYHDSREALGEEVIPLRRPEPQARKELRRVPQGCFEYGRSAIFLVFCGCCAAL